MNAIFPRWFELPMALPQSRIPRTLPASHIAFTHSCHLILRDKVNFFFFFFFCKRAEEARASKHNAREHSWQKHFRHRILVPIGTVICVEDDPPPFFFFFIEQKKHALCKKHNGTDHGHRNLGTLNTSADRHCRRRRRRTTTTFTHNCMHACLASTRFVITHPRRPGKPSELAEG